MWVIALLIGYVCVPKHHKVLNKNLCQNTVINKKNGIMVKTWFFMLLYSFAFLEHPLYICHLEKFYSSLRLNSYITNIVNFFWLYQVALSILPLSSNLRPVPFTFVPQGKHLLNENNHALMKKVNEITFVLFKNILSYMKSLIKNKIYKAILLTYEQVKIIENEKNTNT